MEGRQNRKKGKEKCVEKNIWRERERNYCHIERVLKYNKNTYFLYIEIDILYYYTRYTALKLS